MKILWRIWLIALHLLLLAIVVLGINKAGFGLDGINSIGKKKADHGFGEHYENMLYFHERGDAALPSKRIVLLGDSLVQGLPASAISDSSVNYGIGGDTILGLQYRIPRYESLKKARAILLAIGINDMRHSDNKTIEEHYLAVLQMLPDNVPYYCSAALPVDDSVEREWQGRSNERYKDWNARLQRICEVNGGIYITVPDAFVGDNGALPYNYHDGDGLHLNALGNAVWAAHLKQALSTD